MNQNNLPIIVGILIFDQVAVLVVAGLFEVFSVTRLNEKNRWKNYHYFNCCWSHKGQSSPDYRCLRFIADVSIENCPQSVFPYCLKWPQHVNK